MASTLAVDPSTVSLTNVRESAPPAATDSTRDASNGAHSPAKRVVETGGSVRDPAAPTPARTREQRARAQDPDPLAVGVGGVPRPHVWTQRPGIGDPNKPTMPNFGTLPVVHPPAPLTSKHLAAAWADSGSLNMSSAVSPVYVALGGQDASTCGDPGSPCATLRYAVNNIANQLQPLAAVATVVLGPGVFGSASCGAIATRPINITGAAGGSASTTLNCGGASRGLLAYSDVSLSGITVTGGFVNVSRVCDGTAYVDGGAGVAVMWPFGEVGASATFTDVVLANNTITGAVTNGNNDCGLIGGAGLLLAGGGNGTTVTVRGCVFLSNVENITFSDPGGAFPYGGGASIVVGDPSGVADASPLSMVTVDVSDCRAERNTGGGYGTRLPLLCTLWQSKHRSRTVLRLLMRAHSCCSHRHLAYWDKER